MPYKRWKSAIPESAGGHQPEPRRVFSLRRRLESRRRRPCSDSLYTTAIANFNMLKQPLIWLPGTTTGPTAGTLRPEHAAYSDPLERLNFERLLFASTDQSRPADAHADPARRRLFGKCAGSSPVVFSAERPGSTTTTVRGVDGETRSAGEIARQRAEEVARKAANIQWLRDAFEYASRVRARGVMVMWQADPNFNNDQHLATRAHTTPIRRI